MKLPIGIDDFKELQSESNLSIDKSLFIKDIIDTGVKSLLIARPRRFGKTINLSMLAYFFDMKNATENRSLFEPLNIAQTKTQGGEPCMDQQGQYPVVFISLKSIRASNYPAFQEAMASLMSNIYEQHSYLLKNDQLTQHEKHRFQAIINEQANPTWLKQSLTALTHYMHKATNREVMLLIDEYDTPFHAAYTSREGAYHEDVSDFMKNFIGDAVKTNRAVKKSILTGILKISLMDLFSGANNVTPYLMTSTHYAEYFGFTQAEVETLFQKANIPMDRAALQQWYNGYVINGITLYNPWSILNCLHNNGMLAPYWQITGRDSLLGQAIRRSNPDIKVKLTTLLKQYMQSDAEEASINVTLDDNMVFADLEKNHSSLWALMLFSGYLKTTGSELIGLETFHTIAIPNAEIALGFQKIVQSWFDVIGESNRTALFESLEAGDTESFQYYLQSYLEEAASYHEFGPKTLEDIYHVFILGLLCMMRDHYIIDSNKEAGRGRFDIILIPRDTTQQGILFEFKRDNNPDKLPELAEQAIEQIKTGGYEARFKQHGVKQALLIGLAFSGKKLALVSEQQLY